MSRKVDEDIFDRAINLAKKSPLVHKHGAIIVRNNQIIAEGINHFAPFLMHMFSVHAEVHALSKLKSKSKKFMEECTMIVVRLAPESSDTPCKLSKPCASCAEAIKKSGIRKVFYSI